MRGMHMALLATHSQGVANARGRDAGRRAARGARWAGEEGLEVQGRGTGSALGTEAGAGLQAPRRGHRMGSLGS